MAFASRLIFAFLLCLTFTVSGHAADIVPSGPAGCGADPEPNAANPYGPPDFSPSRECHLGENGPGTATWGWLNACTKWSWCPGWYPTNIVSAAPSCPANSIDVAGSCICQAGFEADNGSCVPENGCPAAGTQEGAAGELYETTGNYPPSSICSGGCSWSTSGGEGCMNGKCFYKGPLTSLNKTCVPSSPGPGDGTTPPTGEPDKTPPEDKQCVEKGLCPFYYNGTKFCTKCDSKEGTSSESGSSSTDSRDADGNPTGSTGSTTTTKETTANCTGDKCTTTTTTTTQNPDGSSTVKTETGELDRGDFCKSNPGHVVCKGEEEGTWGGSCSGGFQCSGDAVQCAQAQASWKAACLFDVGADDPNVVKGGQAMSSDQSALRAQLGLDGAGDDFNLSSMIDSDPLFAAGGGCPSDQQVTLLGQSLTLSLSSWCSWLQTAGTILQAAAYLAAALIVFRRG